MARLARPRPLSRASRPPRALTHTRHTEEPRPLTPAGSLLLTHESAAPCRYAELLACAVEKRHARRGIGRLLVAWAKLHAAAEGLRFLLVSASTDVVEYWRGLGFDHPPARLRQVCHELKLEFDDSEVLHLQLPSAGGGALEAELGEAIARLRARPVGGQKRSRGS